MSKPTNVSQDICWGIFHFDLAIIAMCDCTETWMCKKRLSKQIYMREDFSKVLVHEWYFGNIYCIIWKVDILFSHSLLRDQ